MRRVDRTSANQLLPSVCEGRRRRRSRHACGRGRSAAEVEIAHGDSAAGHRRGAADLLQLRVRERVAVITSNLSKDPWKSRGWALLGLLHRAVRCVQADDANAPPVRAALDFAAKHTVRRRRLHQRHHERPGFQRVRLIQAAAALLNCLEAKTHREGDAF